MFYGIGIIQTGCFAASYVQNSESPVGCISPPQRGQV